jgi:hypothetical protein
MNHRQIRHLCSKRVHGDNHILGVKTTEKVPGWPDKLVKNCPTCGPTHFLSKLIHNLHKSCKKVSPQNGLPAFVIVNKMSKANNHPMGQNAPNLVTLQPGTKLLKSLKVSFDSSWRKLFRIPLGECLIEFPQFSSSSNIQQNVEWKLG